MAVVTFWGSGKEQVGKTLAVVAIATNMSIQYNKKILVISASSSNDTIRNCYWSDELARKNNIFAPGGGFELDNGIEGLAKIIQSNKITPELITNYAKIVFKDRLEVLMGFEKHSSSGPAEVAKIYQEIIQLANQYYDMIIVDLDHESNQLAEEAILNKSDLIVTMASQKISSIKEMQRKRTSLVPRKTMLIIGRYDKNSKYTLKNLSRTFGERKELLAIPYNTLYFEAAQEGNVTDLFLRLRRLEDKNDENTFFIEHVKKATQEIINKINEETVVIPEGR